MHNRNKPKILDFVYRDDQPGEKRNVTRGHHKNPLQLDIHSNDLLGTKNKLLISKERG